MRQAYMFEIGAICPFGFFLLSSTVHMSRREKARERERETTRENQRKKERERERAGRPQQVLCL